MKKLQFLSLVTLALTGLFALVGCQSEADSFYKQAKEYANDGVITLDEYGKLYEIIKSTDDNKLKVYKIKGNLDEYLTKKFKHIKIENPSSSVGSKKFNVNVFLENSASMDGYVKGATEFETSIYNLLGDFKISDLCDSLNLNYINNKIPYKKQKALADDLLDFIKKLEPSVFQQRGGDRSVSDLKNILNTVLKTVNKDNVSILISDFVFSPGKSSNATEYLASQGVGIKIDFAEKLKIFDLAAVVLQLESNFDGAYYDLTNKAHNYKGKRPYYVWLFGSSQNIKAILEKKVLEKIKGGYLNKLVLESKRTKMEPDFKILYNPKIGNFSALQLNEKIITEAKKSKKNKDKGLFGFKLAVDFSNSLQDDDFYTHIENFVLSNKNYKINVEKIKNENDFNLGSYTHIIDLNTSELKTEELKIDIIGKIPSWVKNSSSYDDSNILNDRNEQNMTYGLSSLIEGVSDAFYPKINSNIINTISVTIKK